MKMLAQVACVAAGGAVGAVARFSVYAWMSALGRTTFPWGTLLVNTAGSLLAGVLLVVLTQGQPAQ
ncbi:MAG: hypothetical protein RL434_2394, partial [Pseudomonadota bacterium]